MGINTKDKSNDSIAIESEVNQMNRPNSCCKCNESCSDSRHIHRQAQLMEATLSSPALLEDCSNESTHGEAAVEQHDQPHHFRNQLTASSFRTDCSNSVPDSVFLTSSGSRQGGATERPFSAPANYLEMISGQLLRLVGDHYLCTNCGRQLRNMGDQLTLEHNLRHTFSAVELRVRDS